jgi:transposase
MKMAKTIQQERKNKKKGLPSFPIINPNAAGIDIGSMEHWVAVPEDRDEQPVRKFACFTQDLHAMAAWLKQCKVQTVVMESTGVYWVPVFQILETHGFEVKLVNAKQAKNVPGRKTDVLDCQWLQRLHTYGLLSGSFRPDDAICVLRSYWRHRTTLINYISSHVQHMQKALTQMNVQLHKVISDITGVTGMRIIRAILSGERDPVKLAQMKNYRIQSTTETIAKALEGDYRQEHLFSLRQAVELYDFYQQQVQACDREIEHYLRQLDGIDIASNPIPPSRRRIKKHRGNQPDFDLRTHLYRISGVDFTQIDGLDVLNVQTILSEVGLNPDAFPTVKNFTSWLAICPNNRITGGRIKSRSTRKAPNRAAEAFRMAAYTLTHSSSALGGFSRRMRARLGAPKAITATAHKIARIFYQMWKYRTPYRDLGADYYEQRYKERVLRNMKKTARQIGYLIEFTPMPQTAVS